METSKIWFIGAGIIAVVLLVLFAVILPSAMRKECSTDSDCVPAGCCHQSSCTTLDKKSDCNFCTEVCEPNTMDCGQGSCTCAEGKCRVKWTG